MKPQCILVAGLGLGTTHARGLLAREFTCAFRDKPRDSTATCESFAASWGASVSDFIQWNSGVTCPGLDTSKEYCVIGSGTDHPSATTQHPPTTLSSTTSTETLTATRSSTTAKPSTTAKSSSTTKSSATTVAGNGVATPVPTQDGMVGNCNKFHLVEVGESCASIASLYSISSAQLTQWNPAAKSDCTGLWASTYACVGIIGGATPTKSENGITTPVPSHPGMISNCNKFVKVNPGDTCDGISFWNGVGGGQWVKLWNGVSEDCSNLRVNTYACIGVIEGIPTPTKAGNAIATPSPTQPGMVSNCNKFVKVNPGDTCDGIAFFNGPISTEYLVLWNAGVGPDCRGLQAYTYACIGVIGGIPTPTKAGNGIATPTPTQPGMVGNCNKFVKVNPGDTCDIVAFFNGPISTEYFVLWNAGVGGRECKNLQAGTYACIGVM